MMIYKQLSMSYRFPRIHLVHYNHSPDIHIRIELYDHRLNRQLSCIEVAHDVFHMDQNRDRSMNQNHSMPSNRQDRVRLWLLWS